MSVHITALFYYPIKSCAATPADTVTLDTQGFRFDRRWMVVEAETGQFLTQREHPTMALVLPTASDDGLTVTGPGQESLLLPSLPDEALTRRIVTVWKFTGEAMDEGDTAADWFSAYLGFACRLVRTPDDFTRRVNPEYARPDDRVSFTDGYPVLLASESSLASLNDRLASPVPMNRFRPNIVIAGAEPFAEEGWRTLTTETGVTFRAPKPCTRCAITTVDQATGMKTGKEPLATLAKYPRAPNGKADFGMNLIQDQPGSRLQIGEIIHPL